MRERPSPTVMPPLVGLKFTHPASVLHAYLLLSSMLPACTEPHITASSAVMTAIFTKFLKFMLSSSVIPKPPAILIWAFFVSNSPYGYSIKEIIIAKDGIPWKKVWLIMKRSAGQYYFYISNAGVSVRLGLFVWLNGVRRAIEQCFEEAETEPGTDHYELRKYMGWNHHMITCMPAHFFFGI